MMTFAKDVKQEISNNVLLACCQRAQLSAMILMSSKLVINDKGLSLKIQTSNSMTAKRMWELIRDLFHVEVSLDVAEKQRFNKPNRYTISIDEDALLVLEEVGLIAGGDLLSLPREEILHNECCQRAYLAGAFLASGSVNSPKSTEYHLEISADNQYQAELIQNLMNEIHLNAKIMERRKKYVVYLKASEKISDFLRAVGASHAVLTFEDQRIQRDFRNSFTRLDNMELANEVKTITAGQRQVEEIKLIYDTGNKNMLEPIHIEVADLRLKYPEHSLNELCEVYHLESGKDISKSGMNHRLKRISDVAKKIRENQEHS